MNHKRMNFQYLAMFFLLVSVAFAAPQKGSMTDSRDGQTYKTVKIGDQIWMAENLKYEMAEGSSCLDGKDANCDKYGRDYNWNAAMKACPEKWHLPSVADFAGLISSVGGWKDAGKMLKSKEGWKKGHNGSDAYGFSAKPSDGYGDMVIFWTSTEGNPSDNVWQVFISGDNVLKSDGSGGTIVQNGKVVKEKDRAFKVRCIRDDSEKIVEMSKPIKDSRDGQTYRTVKIGKQVWMAENLNYKTNGSYCYFNEDSFCDNFGRLYSLKARANACPTGWHLPSKEEFEVLLELVGWNGKNFGNDEAAKWLKSSNSWGGDERGSDAFNFSALPAGTFVNGSPQGLGQGASFWSSSLKTGKRGGLEVWFVGLDKELGMVGIPVDDVADGKMSIRCVKDELESIKNAKYSDEINDVLKEVGVNGKEHQKKSEGGIGDGLKCLVGGPGCDNANKVKTAKERFKLPSEDDIDVQGALDKADVFKVIRQHCRLIPYYRRALRQKPGFQGTIVLKLIIDTEGTIAGSSIVSSTTGYDEFDEEIKNDVSSLIFPKSKSGNTTVVIPLKFSIESEN